MSELPSRKSGTEHADNSKLLDKDKGEKEKDGWVDRLPRSPIWVALALVTATVAATYSVVTATDERVDRRVVERLATQEIRDHFDKRIEEKIKSSAADRAEFSKELVDSGYILFTQAIEREFVELIASLGSIELSTPQKSEIRRIVSDYRSNLDRLERNPQISSRQQTKLLLDGFLQILDADYTKAVETLRQYNTNREAIARNYLIGVAYELNKDVRNADRFYAQALDTVAVRSADVRLAAKSQSNRGNAAMRNGDYRQALQFYKEALNTDPTLRGVYVNLAELTVRVSSGDEIQLVLERDKAFQYLCKATVSISREKIIAYLIESQDTDQNIKGRQSTLRVLLGGDETIRTRLAPERCLE